MPVGVNSIAFSAPETNQISCAMIYVVLVVLLSLVLNGYMCPTANCIWNTTMCRDASKTGDAFGRDSSLSATSPQHLRASVTSLRLSGAVQPLAKGPRLFVFGCLDAWLTVSDEQSTSDITCCISH